MTKPSKATKASKETKATKATEDQTMTTSTTNDRITRVTKDQYDKLLQMGMDVSLFEIHDPIEDARKRKVESLSQLATARAECFVDAFDLLDPVTALYQLKRVADGALWSHYNNRSLGEYYQFLLDGETGSEESPMDARTTNLEIDSNQSKWDRVQQHFKDADALHVVILACIYAQETIFKAMQAQMDNLPDVSKAGITAPSEKGYANWNEQRRSQALARKQSNQDASKKAAGLDYMTHNHLTS